MHPDLSLHLFPHQNLLQSQPLQIIPYMSALRFYKSIYLTDTFLFALRSEISIQTKELHLHYQQISVYTLFHFQHYDTSRLHLKFLFYSLNQLQPFVPRLKIPYQYSALNTEYNTAPQLLLFLPQFPSRSFLLLRLLHFLP